MAGESSSNFYFNFFVQNCFFFSLSLSPEILLLLMMLWLFHISRKSPKSGKKKISDTISIDHNLTRGRIFSCVRPFYEQAVSNHDRSMHRSLWAYVAHSSFIEGSHTTKNTASECASSSWLGEIFICGQQPKTQ
jgi:hypothetical protein